MAEKPNTYTPKEAADYIGVTSQSIRRYCDRFARFLSPGASPDPGAVRQLTPEDVYVLGQIYRGTQRGLTYDQIEEELETLTLPERVEIVPEPETLPAVPEGLALLQEMTEALRAMQQTLTDTSDLHARLDRLSDSQATQTGQQTEQQARIAQQLEQIARNQEQLAKATARPLFWAIVGAFVAALVILTAVALALGMGWIG